MDSVLLADGREMPLQDILAGYKHTPMFVAFEHTGRLVLDKVTPSNVLKVKPMPYRFDSDGKPVYCSADRDIPCETLADEYNSRHGAYSAMFSGECMPEDLPVTVVHRNGSVRDCSPANITRQYNPDKARIGMDYYRSVSHSLSLAPIASQVYPLVCMKRDFQKYIDKEFYEARCHDYSDMPVSWNWLADRFGSTESINRAIDNALRENALHRPRIPDRDTKVCLISDVSTNGGRRMTAFMESFLEDKGYRVFSPSRDIKKSYLNPITETEEISIHDAMLSGCDLAIACLPSSLGCFVGDTPIKLAGGNSLPIKDMKRRRSGYKVLSYSVKRKKFSEGFTYGSVLVKKDSPLHRVEFTTGERVHCTPDHPFLLQEGRYVTAECLKPGMRIVSVYNSFVAEIKSSSPESSSGDVYGLEVMTEDKNYAIGAGGAVASNSQLELGIAVGLWYSGKEQALAGCREGLDNLSERDLALINQDKPRIIAFSDCQADLSSLEPRCLRCCSSWDSLNNFLDEMEQTGIRYIR